MVIKSKFCSTIKNMTKVYQIYKKSSDGFLELNQESVIKANEYLSDGKIIALPTDTIYGICCLVNNNYSLNKLYEIKKRELKKPVAICVNNINDIKKWCKVTVNDNLLLDLLPGPITVVFERSSQLNKNLNSDTKLIGIRIPNDNFVNKLTKFNNPIALTSANLSSEPSSSCINEFKEIWPKLDAIFDGGKIIKSDPYKLGSTVIDLSIKNKFKIIREGCALKKVLEILETKYSLIQSK